MTPARLRIAVLAACVLVLGLLAIQVLLHGRMLEIDRAVTAFLVAHRQPGWTALMRLVSDLHETVKLLAVTALLAAWRGWRRDGASVRALTVVPAAMLLNLGLKHLFQRARPVLEAPLVHLATYSFPSGHAVASSVFYGMACVLVWRHARSRALRALAAAAAVTMVLLVGFSRVYLGAHHLSDVLAGTAVGVACVTLFLAWSRRGRMAIRPFRTDR